MKPYYQDEQTTIYHGDCRDVLPHISEVDLILTDPPYGVNYQSGFRSNKFDKIRNDDGQFDIAEVLQLALKCLKDARHIYVFGLHEFQNLPISGQAKLIWDKQSVGIGDLTLPFGCSHEEIAFGVCRRSKAHRERGKGNLAARMRQGSVLRCPRNNSTTYRHPTEKPLALLRQLIESSSCFGETVLDPFCGAGSTLLAAKLEERKSIGIEIEEKYCQIAAERLRQQTLMFSEAI